MDYPLGVVLSNGKTPRGLSLNPYSNGLPSRGLESKNGTQYAVSVLIPILMDYPLGGVLADY